MSNLRNNAAPICRSPRRRAFTFIELSAAIAMLAILLVTTLQMLRALSNHERMVDRRLVAEQAAQAVAEQASNLPWDALTTESAQQVGIPQSLADPLPNAKLAVQVTDENTPVRCKRINVELTWQNLNGQPGKPARLTCWAFPEKQPTP